jgi:uncharacterized RDD family membrane protein YckC
MDDDRQPAQPERPAEPVAPEDTPRRTAPILSAGVQAAPVDWTAPGADGTGGTGPKEIAKGIVLAGIGTRFAAFLVDFFILGCVSVAISLVSSDLIANSTTAYLVATILSAVLAIGYFAVAWASSWSASPGQRLAAIRVVDAATLGPIDPGRALIRSLLLGAALNLLSVAAPLGQILGAVLIIWPFVLFASAIYDARHQGLHDRWTRTLVIRPAEASTFPLTFGCFVIVLIVLLAPLVITMAAGPGIQEWLQQIQRSTRP